MTSIWITCAISAAVLWLSTRAYDGYSACPKQYRSFRHHVQLPCNFHEQSWCTVPGSAYPWHAVRRFVHENHGLMRRMYGDERHISVLRAEIESNDVELVRDPGWHLEDDVKRRYSAKPHFRPANRNHQQPPPPPPEPRTTTTTTTSSPSTASTSPTTASSTTTSSTTPSTTTSTSTTTSAAATTTGTPATSTPLSEPLGLYNGRVHPHLVNASILTSTSPRPPSSSSFASTATSPATSPTTPSTSADTTVEDWATEETTMTTMSSSMPSPSPSAASTTSSTTTSASTSTSTELPDEELADVEDNVADEPDGDADGDGDGEASGPASSVQETLFQDADHLPGPDAAQQPSKPATPLIKLRGVNACPVKEEVVAPFWANNTRGEVLALLNLYPFEQYVHWEKCTHEHKQMFCREGCRCEQQYRLHRLLAYDPNNECRGIFSDWFKFPSCCICRCYDLPAEFRFTSRSPRTPVLRAAAAPAYGSRRSRPSPAAAPVNDWYRLQASSGG
ncbi:protein spaetzle 4 isoform X2 [Thrips palmi]|uniref:Protein spaetzle 4 isoform X2 n=1 Tax=Thrips palmi TaxID=161013 RepID=A0A6P8ZVZ8_THRPL|nr:protein spaetzle 4 isoform X2 [Thrips palmi]